MGQYFFDEESLHEISKGNNSIKYNIFLLNFLQVIYSLAYYQLTKFEAPSYNTFLKYPDYKILL